jgi:hypothetical protein
MKVIIAALIFLGIAIFLMCFNIIFRGTDFPDTEISHNKEMRKRGIICAKEDELRTWRKKVKNDKGGCDDDFCVSCNEICAAKTIMKEKENKK